MLHELFDNDIAPTTALKSLENKVPPFNNGRKCEIIDQINKLMS